VCFFALAEKERFLERRLQGKRREGRFRALAVRDEARNKEWQPSQNASKYLCDARCGNGNSDQISPPKIRDIPLGISLIFIQAAGLVWHHRACSLYGIAAQSRMASREARIKRSLLRLDAIQRFALIPFRLRRIPCTALP